ncbi:MAG: alanine racemase [Anaerolineaceae bacterium]|nr:alanine racemase [Anaerolineaceae bacterium]
MEINTYSTWLEIDLAIIKNNVSLIKVKTGTEVMAVIKANGYGHGAIPAAQSAVKGGATWCGVARIEEALALRRAGISSRILVLGYTPPAKIPDAIDQRISIAIFDPDLTQEYLKYARINGSKLHAHIKVETGMGRLGMLPEDVPHFLKDLKNSNIQVDGIFTHFPKADEPDSKATHKQLGIFNTLLEQLDSEGLKPLIIHAANSAAVINFPESYYNLVRPGNAIFGLHPSPETRLDKDIKPALTWKARITSVRMTPPGRGISYGSKYVTTHNERIGVIPIGYGDGFRRVDGQQVLVRGKRVDIVGRVCMDQCMLQLDQVPEAQVGDEVVLLGKQGDECISAEEIARRWGTINYEVVCGLADRLPRIYKE